LSPRFRSNNVQCTFSFFTTPSRLVAILFWQSLLALVDFWFVTNEWLGEPCIIIGRRAAMHVIGQR
jgi:hypothetical protein